MKPTTPFSFYTLALAAIVLGAPWCRAQTNDTSAHSDAVLEMAPAPKLNKVGLSYRMGMNITVDFKNLGGLRLSNPGPATGSTYNRNYDNGYNRVDITGNANALTWYWGYQSASSHRDNILTLQSESTPATATSGKYEDYPQSGVELSYSHEFARGKRWRVGLEGALGFMAISIKDEQTLNYFVNRTSDSFALGSIVVPLPGYAGTFEGPGPIISSSLGAGDRTITRLPGAATILGERTVDSDVFLLRLGPYLEIPLSRKFAVTLSGGLALGVANTEFSFRETVLISDPVYNVNLNSGSRFASGSENDFLLGGYAGASLSYAVSKRVSVAAGAMFQAVGRSVNNEQGKQSILNLGKSVIVSVGATYSF